MLGKWDHWAHQTRSSKTSAIFVMLCGDCHVTVARGLIILHLILVLFVKGAHDGNSRARYAAENVPPL